DTIDDITVFAVANDLRHRTARPCDHRRAARHGLDHHQPEGFRPIDGKEQRVSVAEKVALLLLPDLADELDAGALEQRLDARLEVVAIGLVDFRRYAQFHTGALGDLHGAIDALFGVDTPEKGQILPGPGTKGTKLLRQTVINRGHPIGEIHRLALVVADGDQGNIAE